MKCCAVIDTNVIVSALLSKNEEAAAVKVIKALLSGQFTPLYHDEIMEEYDDVLHRPKFHFREETLQILLSAIRKYGIEVYPKPTGEILIDMDDLIFYEVAMEKRDDDAFSVTGNQKHFPIRDFIITPAKMMEILESPGE